MTALDTPTTAVTAYRDESLLASHAAFHDRWDSADAVKSDAEMIAHHTLLAEVNRRALPCDCDLTDVTLELARTDEMSTEPGEDVDLPVEVIALLRQAWEQGIGVAQIARVLGPEGYSLRLVPCDPEDDPEEQFADLAGLPEAEAAEKAASTFADEDAVITRNRRRKAAQAPHPFRASRWATRTGTVRCTVCGRPRPADGASCAGLGGTATDESEVEAAATLKAAGLLVQKAEERRFTMGPMYVPNTLDAHGEWADDDELQQATWNYVRAGDRRIRLQHNRSVVAGEWVEIMTWPWEVTVPMLGPAGEGLTLTFPPNTVFMGIVWEPWAWALILEGKLRGLSIGGKANRVLADLPDDGAPAAEPEPVAASVDAPTAESFAALLGGVISEALKAHQPTVNVVMPEERPKTRRVERDDRGNIVGIVEE
jgi:Putative phage serine protease XkdF